MERREAEEAEAVRQEELAAKREEVARENELLSKLTPQQIEQVVQTVTKSTFKHLGVSFTESLCVRVSEFLFVYVCGTRRMAYFTKQYYKLDFFVFTRKCVFILLCFVGD